MEGELARISALIIDFSTPRVEQDFPTVSNVVEFPYSAAHKLDETWRMTYRAGVAVFTIGALAYAAWCYIGKRSVAEAVYSAAFGLAGMTLYVLLTGKRRKDVEALLSYGIKCDRCHHYHEARDCDRCNCRADQFAWPSIGSGFP